LSPVGRKLVFRKARGHHRRVARIVFTQQLKRFTETPEVDAPVATLREAMQAAFAINPRLQGYVLDEQGHLRANVVVFIDGRRCQDRVVLNDQLQADSQVHVLQALSGG
jgi:molybdopterin synthase sulfur carrier subunit